MQAHRVPVGMVLVALGLAGCGQAPSNPLASSSIGQGVQVSPTGTITTATYTITGPSDFASAGTVPVGDSLDVPVTVSSVPVGQGYELDVSATASDGVTVCMGSTTFDVTDPNATVSVTVQLICGVPTGDLAVNATFNLCPVVDDLTAAPLVLNVGGISSMSVAAHDSDNGPSPLSYAWAVNGVKLPLRTQPRLSFACTARGDVTVTTLVSDGDPDPTCADTASVKVTCQ